MDNHKLISLLEIFKLSREKLSFDFINENNEIFEPMFANEDDKVLMSFEIEKAECELDFMNKLQLILPDKVEE